MRAGLGELGAELDEIRAEAVASEKELRAVRSWADEQVWESKRAAAAEIRAATDANEASWGTRVSDIKVWPRRRRRPAASATVARLTPDAADQADLREALSAVSMLSEMPRALPPPLPPPEEAVADSVTPEEAVAAAKALANRPLGSSPRELPQERFGASVAAVVRWAGEQVAATRAEAVQARAAAATARAAAAGANAETTAAQQVCGRRLQLARTATGTGTGTGLGGSGACSGLSQVFAL